MDRRSLHEKIYHQDFRVNWKESRGIFAAGLIALIFMIPVMTAGIPGISIFSSQAARQGILFRFIHPVMTIPVSVTVSVLAWGLGMHMYRFLFHKNRSAFYFSIGINRIYLFWARFQTAVIAICLAVLIPMAASMILNRIAFGAYPGFIPCYLYISFGLILQGIVIYLLTVIACELAGILAEGIIYSMILILGFWGTAYGISQLALHKTEGVGLSATALLRAQSGTTLAAQWRFLNPVLFFLDDLQKYTMAVRTPNMGYPADFSIKIYILWGMIAVLLGMAAIRALRGRNAEQAENKGYRIQVTRIAVFISLFVLFSMVFIQVSYVSNVLAFICGMAADLLLYAVWQKAFLRQHPGFWIMASRTAFMLVAVAILFFVVIAAS